MKNSVTIETGVIEIKGEGNIFTLQGAKLEASYDASIEEVSALAPYGAKALEALSGLAKRVLALREREIVLAKREAELASRAAAREAREAE